MLKAALWHPEGCLGALSPSWVAPQTTAKITAYHHPPSSRCAVPFSASSWGMRGGGDGRGLPGAAPGLPPPSPRALPAAEPPSTFRLGLHRGTSRRWAQSAPQFPSRPPGVPAASRVVGGGGPGEASSQAGAGRGLPDSGGWSHSREGERSRSRSRLGGAAAALRSSG